MQIQPNKDKSNPDNLLGQKIKPKPLTTTFAPIPNWLLSRPEVSFGAKALYGRLVQFSDQDGVAWPSQQTLAKELGIKTRQLRIYLQELVSFLLIGIELRGMPASNRYYFFYHPWMIELFPQDNTQPNLDQSKDRQSSAEQDRQSSAEQDRQSSAEQDRQSSAYNKNKEKNKEKNTHREEKESVCVPNIEVSAYSKKDWFYYAKAQKNVRSPEALADKLAKSKDNDHLMKEFLDNQTQQKQKQDSQLQEQKQKDLKLEKEKQELISFYLSQKEPLNSWQIQFLQTHGYFLSQQQVC